MAATKKPTGKAANGGGKEKTAPASGKAANIHQRMAGVMAEVGTIPKNGYNDYHKYAYATEEDILGTLRPLFVKHGLALSITTKRVEVNEGWRRVEVQFTITNVDKPEENVATTLWGEAEDKKGDKALYKCYTGAMKYWLLKTFMVATGDDPERESVVADKQRAATRHGGGTGGSGVPSSTPRRGGASKKQLNYIYKLGDDLEFDEDDWKATKKHYGVEHTKDLTVDQASDLIERLQQMVKDAEKEAPEPEPEPAPEPDTPPPDPAEYSDEITDALAEEIKSKEGAVTERVNKLFPQE